MQVPCPSRRVRKPATRYIGTRFSSVRAGKEATMYDPGNGLRYLIHFDDRSSGDATARRTARAGL